VREAQEVERLRFPQTRRTSAFGDVPPELDQACLVRVQLQPELREPSTKVDQEPLCVGLMREADDEVVRLCGLPDYAARPVFTLVTALNRVDGRHNRRAGQRVLR
jgi:hypothetical protein